MTTGDKNTPPATSEQEEPLGATSMFLRAFDRQKTEELAANELGTGNATEVSTDRGSSVAGSASAHGPGQRPVEAGGEFTQFLKTIGSRNAEASNPAETNAPAIETKPATSRDGAPGEFTRVFSGMASAAAMGSKETAFPAGATSQGKGSAAAGTPNAESAAGSFTQLFKAPSGPPNSTPAIPVAAAQRVDSSKSEPPLGGREVQSNPNFPAGSVTSILSSLASASGRTGMPHVSEPAAYRPEVALSNPAVMPNSGLPGAEPSVTQFIKKLAQEPAAPAPAVPASPVIVPSSDPGEFTRMISNFVVTGAPGAAAQVPPTAPGAAGGGPSISAQASQMSGRGLPGPIASTPGMAPKTTGAPPMPVPQVQVPVLPQVPLSTPPTVAIGPPKSKLEALVPMLLVINTFLLLIILVVLIFLIKGR